MDYLNDDNKSSRGSGKKLKVHFDLPMDEDCVFPPNQKNSACSSISSESSLDSDSDDDSEKGSNHHHHNIDNFESKNDGNGHGSPHVWGNQGGLATQSPRMQTMSPSAYDPNRIPSSVFSSPNYMEWSVQSNESLFSIHVGNASFSRDHVFALNKSGDLPWTSDLASIPPCPTPLSPVQEVVNKQVEGHYYGSSDISDDTASLFAVNEHKKTGSSVSSVAENDLKKTESLAGFVVENEHKQRDSFTEVKTTVIEKTPKDIHVVPHHELAKPYNAVSYRSAESDKSFHFPILTLDGGRHSSSTVGSEKQEKNEQLPSFPEEPVEKPEEPKEPEKPKLKPEEPEKPKPKPEEPEEPKPKLEEPKEPEKPELVEPPIPETQQEQSKSGRFWCFNFSCTCKPSCF